jgi:hypothetical protein
MTAKLKARLWAWAGTACVAAAAAGVIAPNFLVAQPPTEKADKTEKAEPEAVVASTFIGELKGAPESARIAVVLDGDKFVAYVCSGDQSFNDTFSRWFRGAVKDGGLSAKTDCEAVLKATAKGDVVSGSITKEGKTHEFTATKTAGDSNAGLFRAGDTFSDTDFVVGWIIDEKENVVGTGGVKGGKVQTLNPPKPGASLQAEVKKKGEEKGKILEPGKVTGAGTGPEASKPGRKLDAAAQAELVKDLVADRKATGGNAIQAMLINQVKRFNAGKKPETKLEEKTFAILKTAPKGSLEKYEKAWDKLPKADRDTILGPAAKDLDESKGLDGAVAKRLVAAMTQVKSLKGEPRSALSGTVKKVSIPTLKCLDETNPEVGKDEIFAIHTVIVGNSAPQVKRTAILDGMKDGVSKNFAAADADVFPLAGLTPTEGAEVFVVTTLYEDDGAGLVAFLNFLKPLIQTGVVLAVEALNGDAKKLTEVEKVLIKLAVDAALSAASGPLQDFLVRPLGTDSIVVKPDGSVTAENGGAKNKMTFKLVKNGDVRFNYELSGFNVQK